MLHRIDEEPRATVMLSLQSGDPFAWRMTALRALPRAMLPTLGVSHPKCIPKAKLRSNPNSGHWLQTGARSKNRD